jgi:hypothetical protein
MSRQCFGVGNIEQLQHLCSQLVDELFSAIGVNLSRNSKFAEPFFENGISYCFSVFILDRSTTAYLVKASVMHNTNFLSLSAVSIGPNKSV